ncbi:MAG: hypothetical protein E7371_03690 [Clostridiales bacterium]|nr:hypothetical protein [Clostridiales bacterium]
MTSVYTDADYLAVYKQKKKIFGIFWAVTAVYVIFCIAWWIYYMGLPYADPMQKLPKACVFVSSVLYVIFAYVYLSIKGSRIKRYFKLMGYLSDGLKNEEKNYFYTFEKKTLQKDNIDVWGCVFETWSKKRQEWLDREAYWDNEKPLPALESGDYVKYIVQSNFIVQYEILEKHALEFEEVDEEEYEAEEDDYVPSDEETSGEAVQ